MTGLRFSVAGPGRVGRSLAHWLVAVGGELVQTAARRPAAARSLSDALGGVPAPLAELSTAGEDLLLVAVADRALAEVAAGLAGRAQADVALHVSGSTPAAVLAGLRRHGSAVGSLHPLRAFPEIEPDVAVARGTLFGLDGDERAVELSRRLVGAWEGRTVVIEPERRRLYHLAASLAAGGVVTVLAVVRRLIERAGLPAEVETGYYDLAHQALAEAAAAERPAAALTGPAARGDAELVARQIADLESAAPELVEVVIALLEETRRRRVEAVGPDAAYDELGRILAKAKQRKSFLDPT